MAPAAALIRQAPMVLPAGQVCGQHLEHPGVIVGATQRTGSCPRRDDPYDG